MIRVGVRSREGEPWTWTSIDADHGRLLIARLRQSQRRAERGKRAGHRTRLRIPDVVGIDVDAAQDLLAERGFDTRVRVLPDRWALGFDNTVVAQSPQGGSPVRAFGSVVLTISEPPILHGTDP